MKQFNKGDKVCHKDFKGKIGTIVKKVPDSDFYYVKMSWKLWSMNVNSLKRVV